MSALSWDPKSQEERLEQSVSQSVSTISALYDRLRGKGAAATKRWPKLPPPPLPAGPAWRSRQEIQVVNYSPVCLLRNNIVEGGRGVGKHIADRWANTAWIKEGENIGRSKCKQSLSDAHVARKSGNHRERLHTSAPPAPPPPKKTNKQK